MLTCLYSREALQLSHPVRHHWLSGIHVQRHWHHGRHEHHSLANAILHMYGFQVLLPQIFWVLSSEAHKGMLALMTGGPLGTKAANLNFIALFWSMIWLWCLGEKCQNGVWSKSWGLKMWLQLVIEGFHFDSRAG